MTSLTLLRTLSFGYIGKHPLRTFLVILSITLGVTMLVATQALKAGINRGIQEGVNPLSGVADLVITNSQSGVPYEMARDLREAHIEGVAEVTPFLFNRVSVADLNNKVVWLIGVEWPNTREERRRLRQGHNPLDCTFELTDKPKAPREFLSLLLYPPALASKELAADLRNKSPGKRPTRFRLRNAGMTPEVTLLGTVDFTGSKLPLRQSHVVIMDLLSASYVCYPDDPGAINQIAIRVKEGVNPAEVQQRIQGWLGNRAQVQPPTHSMHLVSDVTAGLNIGFGIGGVVALVVGLFLVYNILSVSVAERRHDIGILRSVGATRRQIANLFMGEAMGMGLVGSALGLPLGWGLSWLAVKPAANLVTELIVPIDSASINLPWTLVGGALVSGTLVAILAALVPALQAAREEPADAVRRVPLRTSVVLVGIQIGGTLALLLLGLAIAKFRQELPFRMGPLAGYTGVGLLVVGGLLAMPLLASLLGRAVQPFFRLSFGLEGRLAADNLVRSPGRTGIVIAALAATGGLMVMTAGFLKSTRDGIREWVDEKIAADLFVTSGSSVTSGGAAVSMQQEMLGQLQSLKEVDAVLPVRFHRLDFAPDGKQEKIIFLVAIDTKTFLSKAGDRPLARRLEKFPELRQRGKVVVSENFSALYHIKKGDRFKIPGHKNGKVEVEVVGTVVDYSWNRGTIILDRDWFREEYSDNQVDVFDLFLKPGADVDAVRQKLLDRYGESDALFAYTRPEVSRDVEGMLNKAYALAYVQQGVVGLVALLGVVSALFISVLQRRQQLGLLRAVGACRMQILRSVLAEAVLMGVIGAMVGFSIGLLLEWYVLDILLLDESGFTFPLRVPWIEAGGVILGSIIAATLAGLWPAYRATRLRIPEAIAYE